MARKRFYVTTAIDYVNDVIHIGHAYQKVLADLLYRYHKLIGDDAYFLTGTDNHGGKAEEGAAKAGIPTEKFSRKISDEDEEQLLALNIKPNRFIRTTDPDHKETVYKLYKKIKANGDIYLAEYEGLYCPGCEEFKTKRDLIGGKCPEHPTAHLETLTEENYFFKLSKYQNFLIEHIADHPEFVKPEGRRKEVLAFLKNEPLKDTPISRPKVKWGIPFPDNPDHTFYVWFEALINYVTGAPAKYWPADIHLIGKDNLRFHAVLWPAMLKSAGMKLPKTVYAHGFLSLEGQKISKSLGNIIRPKELVEEFGADAVRYYLARYGPLNKDANISREHLKEVYNADLANGLGNLVARVAKLAERADFRITNYELRITDKDFVEYRQALEDIRPDKALEFIWSKISKADRYIDREKPWEKEGRALEKDLNRLTAQLLDCSLLLGPFMPETAEKIQKQFAGPKIKAEPPLFPRLLRQPADSARQARIK